VSSPWGLHFCPLDADCRQVPGGAPWRLYLLTPWGTLIVAFKWSSRTQLWLPWKTRVPWARAEDGTVRSGFSPDGRSNYSRWWSPVVWHPKDREL